MILFIRLQNAAYSTMNSIKSTVHIYLHSHTVTTNRLKASLQSDTRPCIVLIRETQKF